MHTHITMFENRQGADVDRLLSGHPGPNSPNYGDVDGNTGMIIKDGTGNPPKIRHFIEKIIG